MKRIGHWARRAVPTAIVLLYHRVAEPPLDPQLLCVSPQHFAEHLEILRRRFHPLSLRSLRRRMALNMWSPHSVVVTFDDGYADNLYHAMPLLEAAEIPATVFVTTGHLDSQKEFWWDELERILLSTTKLPGQLELTINGQDYRWSLSHEDVTPATDCRWHVLMTTDMTCRQAAYCQIADLFRGIESGAQEHLLVRLRSWAGLSAVGRSSNRPLTGDELHALASGGLIEVGAHTVSHPVLGALPLESQRTEIVASKETLESILGRSISSFSYPFGGRQHYTPDTVGLVRGAKYSCACSNFPGHVHWKTDPFELPRFLVRDWNGEEFARRLEGWFAG